MPLSTRSAATDDEVATTKPQGAAVLMIDEHSQAASDKHGPAANHNSDIIVDRLEMSFPEMDTTEIRDVVENALRDFQGARMQQFVPLLAEKIARDECRHLRNAHVPEIHVPRG
jgi:hypothetical protein